MKETPMSADIDEEGTGEAVGMFDIANGVFDDQIEQQLISSDVSTHYAGCWFNHRGCALAEILRLRAYIRTLEHEVVGVHEGVEGHEGLVQELDRLNEDKQNLIGELHNMTTQRDELVQELHELSELAAGAQWYKSAYMNAFAAVRAMANLVVPEPKG